MWSVRTWATASHEQAIANARSASTACSRRRVEREEVALFLATRAARAAGDHGHTAASMTEHPA